MGLFFTRKKKLFWRGARIYNLNKEPASGAGCRAYKPARHNMFLLHFVLKIKNIFVNVIKSLTLGPFNN